MKRLLVLLLFLALLPTGTSQESLDELFSASLLQMDLTMTGTLDVIPESGNAAVSDLVANFSYVPQESEQQSVRNLLFTPGGESHESYVVFRWGSPPSRVQYTVSANIQTTDHLPTIKSHIPFPVFSVPEDIEPYTMPSQMIDSDSPDVQALAQQLAEGETELYSLVFRVASWVEHNIEYDLNTLTADVTQNATWVLETREGVCDEITTLFIALLRALNVPARFVSGVAYTNFQEKDDWGPHGWAEVWFPEVGWVPFDVTYKEFGYLDPTHIKLKDSIDSGEPTVQYQWSAVSARVEGRELDSRTTLRLKGLKGNPKVSLLVKPFRGVTGFGSWNLIEGRATSLRDVRLVADIHLVPVQGMNVEQPLVQYVLLDPGESKSVYWLVHPAGQRSGYRYTYPLEVFSSGAQVKSSFTAGENSPVASRQEFATIMEALLASDEKSLVQDLRLECSNATRLHLDESPELVCLVQNTGSTALRSLRGCIAEQCESFDLPIAQTHTMRYPLTALGAGQHALTAKVTHSLISRIRGVELELLDHPKVSVTEVSAPNTVEFGENFTLGVLLTKSSYLTPEQVRLSLLDQTVAESPLLEGEQRHIITVDSSLLRAGKNRIEVVVSYQDDRGGTYESRGEANLTVINVPLSSRTTFFLQDFAAAMLRTLTALFS